jgi:hypothetical protein
VPAVWLSIMLAATCTVLVLGEPASSALSRQAQSAKVEKTTKTDTEIRETLIKASIAAYSGSCPCPYNTDRAGTKCGKRSAYSKPGGAAPLCYPDDVNQKMVDEYRKRSVNAR